MVESGGAVSTATDDGPPAPRFALSFRALVAIALWGASFVAVRVALDRFTPVGLCALRLVVGSALLAALVRARGAALLPRREDRPRCVLLGVVLGVHLVIQAVGLRFTTAVNTGWIIGIIPAMIALGAHVVLGQRLRPSGWGGIVVATAGVLLVTSATPAEFAEAGFGDALQLVSCVTWTVYTLAALGVLRRNGSLTVTTCTMGVAAVVLLVALPFAGVFVEAPVGDPADSWWAFGFLAVACSAAAYLLWSLALESHGATRVGAVLYLEPLFTLGAAVVVLDEPVGPHTLAGGALVMLGVWVVGRAARAT